MSVICEVDAGVIVYQAVLPVAMDEPSHVKLSGSPDCVVAPLVLTVCCSGERPEESWQYVT